MILKQGHTYRAMPHDGKVIRRIYRGGRCYYKDSPYSLAATQALKAAFPQYFAAICNYGYAHPQLVPFINEDPMLIVSLVEVGKTRWLVGDGKAYINSRYTPDTNTSFFIKAKTPSFLSNAFLFGSRTEVYTQDSIGIICDNSNGNIWCMYGTKSTYKDIPVSLPVNTIFECELTPTEFKKDGEIIANIQSDFIPNGRPMFVFGSNSGNKLDGRTFSGGIAILYTNEIHFIPHLRPNGEAGMLDIVSLTFYPNANTSGQFAIQLTDKA